jgi:protein tyrosine/serine phosphatase
MKIRISAGTALAAILFLLATPVALAKEPVEQSQTQAVRPAAWATPVAVAGAPNLNRVDKNFYRSAQPEAAGFQALVKDPGIKTVVSLRAFHSDRALLDGTGIKLIRVPIFTWHIETEDVVKALASIRKAERKGPVLLHCQHGADRTGLITALYRVLYQGWTKDAALDEMQNGNFGYHAIWGNIPRYIRKVDVEDLRKMVEKAGV